MPNTKLFWFKLKTSFLTSNAVNYFMSLPERSEYVMFYQALTLTTLNTNGVLVLKIGKITREMDPQYLSQACKYWDTTFIKNAIQLYLDIELLKIDNNGFKYLVDFEDNIGSEWKSAERMREKRKKETENSEGHKSIKKCPQKGTQSTPLSVLELDLDLEKDKDLEKELEHNSFTTTTNLNALSDKSDKSDKAISSNGEYVGFVKELIEKKIIERDDVHIQEYQSFFDDLYREYPNKSMIGLVIGYVGSQMKQRRNQINNRYGYVTVAIREGLQKVYQDVDIEKALKNLASTLSEETSNVN